MLADRLRMRSSGDKFDDNTGSPGNNMLLKGTKDAGYYGKLTYNEVISPVELVAKFTLPWGSNPINPYTDWLKFSIDGKTIFITQKHIRNKMCWNDLNGIGLVYGSIITHNGISYKVRLLKGGASDPANIGLSDQNAKGSEWNKLLLPLSYRAGTTNWNKYSNVGTIENWGINFTDEELDWVTAYSIVQETQLGVSSNNLMRGYFDGSYLDALGKTNNAYSAVSWRPVLEVVE